MEGRVWAMLAAFLLIVCFAAVVSYNVEVNSKRTDWALAQSNLESTQQALSNMEIQVETARKVCEKVEAERDEEAALVANRNDMKLAVEKLKTDIDSLQNRRKDAVDSYKLSVQDVRAAAVGTTWPEFTQGAKTYRGVRIRGITDSEVTFAHDEGVAKLDKEALPQAARDRFRIDLFPMIAEEASDEGAASEMAEALAAAGKSPVTSEGKDAPQGMDAAAVIQQIQEEINVLEAKLTTLTESKNKWLGRAYSLRYEASRASTNGKPVYATNKQALQAEKNAELYDVHLQRVQKEIESLAKKQQEVGRVGNR